MPDGTCRLGGTVTFAARLACSLGLKVAIVTSGRRRDAEALQALLPNVQIALVPAPATTVFENIYQPGGRRTQYLRCRAAELTGEAVPEHFRGAALTLLGPIADEVTPHLVRCLDSNFVAATPQGWLRSWDAGGLVFTRPWQSAEALLPHLDALVLSVEDLAQAAGEAAAAPSVIAKWAQRVETIALTDGAAPARLWLKGDGPVFSPACAAAEVDPTGAGDTFATAFVIALKHYGAGVLQAARFAHAAAAFVVESPGADRVPTHEQIAARMAGGTGKGA